MRKQVIFNENWLFCLGDDPVYALREYNDSNWRTLSLPHDWDVEFEPDRNSRSGSGGGYAHGGIGWYRKRFHKPEGSEGKILSLLFEGVYMDSAVYLNGKPVGGRHYGYSYFSVSLKDVEPGDNVIAVRVNNSQLPNSRWYSGSGIYRNVWLIETEPVHIALDGLRCQTEALASDGESAALQITAELFNESDIPAQAEITYSVQTENELCSSAGAALWINSQNSSRSVTRLTLSKPHLWTVEDPYLYDLTASVRVMGKLVDERMVKIGIRTAEFDSEKGFLLNGSPVKIKGVCLHHDSGLFGAAFYRGVWERRLKQLKEMGCNGIRSAHNPPASELLELCDEMGFLVMDEAFDEWALGKNKNENYYSENPSFGYSQYFSTDAETDLAAMIRRDFNHPSVILWSVGNEIPEQSSKDGADRLKKLVEICRREDPTRAVTSACDNIYAPEAIRTRREFENALDVVGYNYVGRWRDRAETFYDQDRHLFQHRKFIGSENPSVGGVRGDYRLDHPYNFNYVSAAVGHELLWRYTASRTYVAGDYVWTGFDHLGEAAWPYRGAAVGPIDTAGFQKDAFYYFRSIWNEKEVTLHLLPHWNWKGDEGQFKQVLCYTNCELVRLFCNGRLVGEKGSGRIPRYGATEHWDDEQYRYHPTTNDLHLSWDVPYEPGTLRAEGYIDGKLVKVCEVQTTGDPESLQATKEIVSNPWQSDLVMVRLSACDSLGRTVPTAEPMVSVQVTGEVRLVGMDSGDLSDLSLYGNPQRRMLAGQLLAVFARSGNGEAKAAFSVSGLSGIEITL